MTVIKTTSILCLVSTSSVISGVRRGVNEIFALLEFYTDYIGSYLPMFRDNISLPSSRVKQSKKNALGNSLSSSCFSLQ
jgi:hypothetical protein